MTTKDAAVTATESRSPSNIDSENSCVLSMSTDTGIEACDVLDRRHSQEKHVNFAKMAVTKGATDEESTPVPIKDEEEIGINNNNTNNNETTNTHLSSELTPTDSTSEAFSVSDFGSSGNHSNIYEVIEYDPNDNVDFLNKIEPHIEDNTPAAEALRANANVRVSTVGKAARAMHMQALRRFVKRATGQGRSGVVRGKPPRLPPRHPEQPSDKEALSEIQEDTENEIEQVLSSKSQTAPATPINSQSPHIDSESIIPDAVVVGTAEAGKKVLGSVDPHDMLKMLRWRRKKKGQEKERKSYVKGKVIDGEHELYTLSIAVMIGVRTSISKTNIVLNSGPKKRWVLPQDFRTTEKYEFRPKGGTATPPHRLAHTFKFKDYCPVVFAYLRRLFGNNEFDFLLSVCGNANFIEFISNAKSGQFFFYSGDGKYMIKTMTNSESRFLRRILPEYFRHCCENPNTLITRFYGMYRVKLYHLRRNVKFVIMNSVYYTDKYLQTFYDLKGSVVGRDAKPGQAVLKDNDLRRRLPEEAIALSPPVRSNFRHQLVSDCDFLQEMSVMDYSMLVGVHHVPPAEDKRIATTGFRVANASSNKHRRANSVSEADLTASREDPHLRSKTLDFEPLVNQYDVTFTPNTKDQTKPHQLESPGSMTNLLPRTIVNMLDLLPSRPDPMSRARRHLSDATHRRTSNDQPVGHFLDDDLDDDDDSYLEGSKKRPNPVRRRASNDDTEYKKQATVEKLFWPFHRLYDIHGHRLLAPVICAVCRYAPCECDDEMYLLKGYNVPKFVPPLSERKDGGLEMDTTGLALPLKYQGPEGEKLYQGKIFYMGIIDVLQEYTSRKMLEAHYRAIHAAHLAASCVPPKDYGDRFVSFFDEYSQRKPTTMGVEIDLEYGVRESSSFMAEN